MGEGASLGEQSWGRDAAEGKTASGAHMTASRQTRAGDRRRRRGDAERSCLIGDCGERDSGPSPVAEAGP